MARYYRGVSAAGGIAVALVAVALEALMVRAVVRALKSGTLKQGFSTLTRSEQPLMFWLNVAARAGFVVAIPVGAIKLVLSGQ
jgi:hypothetical protein